MKKTNFFFLFLFQSSKIYFYFIINKHKQLGVLFYQLVILVVSILIVIARVSEYVVIRMENAVVIRVAWCGIVTSESKIQIGIIRKRRRSERIDSHRPDEVRDIIHSTHVSRSHWIESSEANHIAESAVAVTLNVIRLINIVVIIVIAVRIV